MTLSGYDMRMPFLCCLRQGCTNAGHQVGRTTKYCTMVPNICGCAIWNLLLFLVLLLLLLYYIILYYIILYYSVYTMHDLLIVTREAIT